MTGCTKATRFQKQPLTHWAIFGPVLTSTRSAFSLYLLLAAIEVAFRAFWPEGEVVVKPLLMPALAWWLWRASRQGEGSWGKLEKWTMAALFMSWLGDVFLLGQTDTRFMLGLASFLLAHLAYVVAFNLGPTRKTQNEKQGLAAIPWVVLPLGLFAAGLVLVLWPNLGDMRAPVLVYAAVIATMAIASFHRFRRVPARSFILVALGACTFVLSDATIAWNKFGQAFSAAGPLIMITYLAAQGWIVSGIVAQRQNT